LHQRRRQIQIGSGPQIAVDKRLHQQIRSCYGIEMLDRGTQCDGGRRVQSHQALIGSGQSRGIKVELDQNAR
jgi:hypothetical protein